MSAKFGPWGHRLDVPVLGGAWQNNKGDTMNKDPNRGTERFRSFDEFMDFAYYEAREIHALAWATNWALYNPDHRLDQDELITRAKQLIHASEIKAEALFKLLGNWEDLQRAAASSGERS